MSTPVSRAKWIVPPGLQQVVNRFNIKSLAIAKSKETSTQRHLLLHGPTGVGKSMFTDFFVRECEVLSGKTVKVTTVNCAAIPETLLESELFGYEEGAHSTAKKAKAGYFELATDGILVLEEIGEMPMYLQAKLLVAIEKREFYRVGGVKPIEFRAHIVATTNVGREKFRDDFWFRFDSFKIPAIHERREDILYYIDKFNPTLLGQLKRSTVLSLLAYNWPGNVREIRRICHVVEEELQALGFEDIATFNMANAHLGDYDAILRVDESDCGIDFNKPRLLRRSIDKKASAKKLVKTLQPYGIGFDFMSFVFPEDERLNMQENRGNRYCIRPMNQLYNLAYAGMLVFCKIFFKNIQGDYDLLNMTHNEFDSCDGYLNNELKDYCPVSSKLLFPKLTIEEGIKYNRIPQYVESSMHLYTIPIDGLAECAIGHAKLICQTLEFLTGIKGVSLNDLNKFTGFCRRNSDNKFIASMQGLDLSAVELQELPIESINVEELLLLYYETVCSVTGTSHGYQKEVAAIAGKSTARISEVFKKYGLKEKFGKQNFMPKKRLMFLAEESIFRK